MMTFVVPFVFTPFWGVWIWTWVDPSRRDHWTAAWSHRIWMKSRSSIGHCSWRCMWSHGRVHTSWELASWVSWLRRLREDSLWRRRRICRIVTRRNSNVETEDETQPDSSPGELKATSKPSAATQPFRLRVLLRSAPLTRHSTDDEEAEEDKKRTRNGGIKRPRETRRIKQERHVKFKDEETAVAQPPPSLDCGSDSAEDVLDTFLARREQNIKANKAMLAQLMADLQKMPGGAGILKKQAGKQKAKERSSRPPRSGSTEGESRRNPERATRRQTRSMAAREDLSAQQESEGEPSLEEELLEVRRAPRRRGTPRPNRSKPHVVRPVEDITEDELQLVADNMTDKTYNSVTVSSLLDFHFVKINDIRLSVLCQYQVN
uniref:Uncharacterized protein n=1 Tax=Acanthochromis polyacanthus TaxID=80966 RepID=A0A3Q1FFQ2_9TELE